MEAAATDSSENTCFLAVNLIHWFYQLGTDLKQLSTRLLHVLKKGLQWQSLYSVQYIFSRIVKKISDDVQ